MILGRDHLFVCPMADGRKIFWKLNYFSTYIWWQNYMLHCKTAKKIYISVMLPIEKHVWYWTCFVTEEIWCSHRDIVIITLSNSDAHSSSSEWFIRSPTGITGLERVWSNTSEMSAGDDDTMMFLFTLRNLKKQTLTWKLNRCLLFACGPKQRI